MYSLPIVVTYPASNLNNKIHVSLLIFGVAPNNKKVFFAVFVCVLKFMQDLLRFYHIWKIVFE